LETFVEIKTKSMQMVKMVKGIGALQRKCGSQARMVEPFRGLRAKGHVEENAMLKKYVIAKEAWFAVNERSNKCK
jgi:hypothetical protein